MATAPVMKNLSRKLTNRKFSSVDDIGKLACSSWHNARRPTTLLLLSAARGDDGIILMVTIHWLGKTLKFDVEIIEVR